MTARDSQACSWHRGACGSMCFRMKRARQKAKNPAALKVRVGSYADFAKQVSTAKVSFNPTHTNLQQNSDGTIASVYFDFVFLADGKETNRGSETWVLVKGSDGWRIAGMTYSSNPPVR